MTARNQPSRERPSLGGERDPEALARFIERFTIILMDTGFPRMPARVFAGLLTADDGRRTAGELAEALRVSPAAVSGAVRYLGQIGLVTRERDPGRRSDHYRVLNDLWYEAVAQRDGLLLKWDEGLREGVSVLGQDTPAGARLEETRLFFEFVRGELPGLLEKWRALHPTGRADPNA